MRSHTGVADFSFQGQLIAAHGNGSQPLEALLVESMNNLGETQSVYKSY